MPAAVRQPWRLLLWVPALLIWATSHAGSLHVQPTRILLSPDRPIASLEVQNTGERESLIQVERFAWSQVDGTDKYAPTGALIVTPPIFSLPPGERQVLRLGLRDNRSQDTEQSFRIYVREVPVSDERERKGLLMALRIGIPVFVAPREVRPLDLIWQTEIRDGALYLHARNNGNRHVHLMGLKFDTPADTGLSPDHAYLLAGQTRSWYLPIALDSVNRLELSGSTQAGRLHVELQGPASDAAGDGHRALPAIQ